MELSKFSDEIMRSEEVRQHKLIQIDLLKSDIAQLIEQLLLQIKLEPINKKKIKEYIFQIKKILKIILKFINQQY